MHALHWQREETAVTIYPYTLSGNRVPESQPNGPVVHWRRIEPVANATHRAGLPDSLVGACVVVALFAWAALMMCW